MQREAKLREMKAGGRDAESKRRENPTLCFVCESDEKPCLPFRDKENSKIFLTWQTEQTINHSFKNPIQIIDV